MTRVEITRRDGHILGVAADGHTGFGAEGEDIVCAALSSVIQTALLGLLQAAGLAVDYQVLDQNASLRFELKGGLDETERLKADMILDTMLLGIRDLHENWSDFIGLTVIEK
ncbi:MAG: ribosomal-processing cysteine protease Prp [Clostridiales bacterium]|jgi:uncharacterized protein YsxB (DUF464 family)|nr:ribosomal-processing cysteine protease Prp [Clostridiales bacterium]